MKSPPDVVILPFVYSEAEKHRIELLTLKGMSRQEAITVVREEHRKKVQSRKLRCEAKPRESGRADGPPAAKADMDLESPIKVAELLLGKRLSYNRDGARLLDGKPCSLDEMMRETNRLRVEAKMPPVGKNAAWMP